MEILDVKFKTRRCPNNMKHNGDNMTSKYFFLRVRKIFFKSYNNNSASKNLACQCQSQEKDPAQIHQRSSHYRFSSLPKAMPLS